MSATPPAPRAMAQRAGGETQARAQMTTPAPVTASEPAAHRRIDTYPALVALAAEKRDLQIKAGLEADLRLVRMEDGRLEVALERSAARTLVNELSRKLEQWTGRRWTVVVSNEAGQATLREQAKADKDELTRGVHEDPRVKAVMARFPGTQVIDVRKLAPELPSDDAHDPPPDDLDGDDR